MSAIPGSIARRAAQLLWVAFALWCLVPLRFLVICTGPHAQGSVEFAHAAGSCCGDHHEAHDGCGDDHRVGDSDGGNVHGDHAESSRGRCWDVPLAIDEGPLPERVTIDLHSDLVVAVLEAWCSGSLQAWFEAVRPPATGPPRTDQRTELLATTLLLI